MALTEKQRQNIEKHKAEVAAREKAKAEKKKKAILTLVTTLAVIVVIVCAIAIPVSLSNKTSYADVRLSRLLMGNGEGASEETLKNANQKVKITGYLFECQPSLLYMTTQTVSQCPYNSSAYPTNYIPVVYANGANFDLIDSTKQYTVYGTLYVGDSRAAYTAANGAQETSRVILYVDKLK